jgi:hypothetical protein
MPDMVGGNIISAVIMTAEKKAADAMRMRAAVPLLSGVSSRVFSYTARLTERDFQRSTEPYGSPYRQWGF